MIYIFNSQSSNSARLRTKEKKMNYKEIKAIGQKEFSEFKGIFFAFSNEQFSEGMKKIGAESVTELVDIGAGGFILKSKKAEFKKLIADIEGRKQDFLNKKENFYDAVLYELRNHEYGYTGDHTDALEALGKTYEDLSLEQKDALQKAKSIVNDEAW